MKTSFLESTRRRSPLMEAQRLNNKAPKKVGVKELAQVLPLTSLIDAFSIIVIYLLIGTQSGGFETPVAKVSLPVAENAQMVESEPIILKLEKNQFYLNEQPVAAQNLTEKLAQLKQSSKEKNIELMIQADNQIQYAQLDPIIKAGSLAGIEKLKFAVLPPK